MLGTSLQWVNTCLIQVLWGMVVPYRPTLIFRGGGGGGGGGRARIMCLEVKNDWQGFVGSQCLPVTLNNDDSMNSDIYL